MTIGPLYSSNAHTSLSAVGPVKSFPPKDVQTVADALASIAGFAQNGTLVSALEPQNPSDFTGPNPNSSLAAQLNPGVNIKLNASLQVTDFVGSSTSAGTNIGTSSTSTSGADSNSSTAQSSTATSAYNSVASASTSTIRGSSINATA